MSGCSERELGNAKTWSQGSSGFQGEKIQVKTAEKGCLTAKRMLPFIWA